MTKRDNCGGCGGCLWCAVDPLAAPTSVPTLDSDPTHLARAAGAATSAQAALRVAPRTGSQKARLLLAYRSGAVLSDAAAAERAGLEHTRSWWKRCSDLRRDGLIVQVGVTTVRGEQVMACKITAAGEELVALLGGAQ